MATKFITPSWRMPKNSNQSKASNYSIDFDGATQFIDLGNTVEILPGQPNPSGAQNISNPEWSVSCFVNFSALGAQSCIVSTGRGGGSSYFEIRKSTSDKIEGYFRTSSGGYTTITGDTTVTLGTWYHVCITWSNGNLNLYLNGVSDCDAVSATNFYFAGDGFLPLSTIGRFRYGTGGSQGRDQFGGKLDHVAIFNYGLDSNAVTTLWGGGIPGNPLAIKPPIAYYNLGQGSAYAEGSAGIVEPNLAQATGSTVFEFNSSKIVIGNNLNITTEITLAAWINSTSTSGTRTIIAQDRFSAQPQRDWHWLFNSSNSLVFRAWEPGTNSYSAQISNAASSLLDGNWHHICVTWDGTTNADAIKMAFDGQVVKTATATATGIKNESPYLPSIGSYHSPGSQGYYYSGEMSNVQIWDKGITDSEITTLYNNGTPLQSNIPQSGSLKAWYKLNLEDSYYMSDNAYGTEYWQIGEAQANYSSALNTKNYGGLETIGTAINDYFGDDVTKFSLSFWTNPEDLDGSATGIFQVGYPNMSSYSNGIWASTYGVRLYLPPGNSNYIQFPDTQELGKWNHVLITYDGTQGDWADGVKCFLNGQPISSNGNNGTFATSLDWTSANSNQRAIMIANAWSNGYSYDGFISNYALYDTVLGQTEATSLYNNGTPTTSKVGSPVAWWKLNNHTTGYLDNSGNGYNLQKLSNDPSIVDVPVSALNGISSGMDSTNLVPSNLIKSIPYSGYSMNFDAGDSDYIEIPNNSSLQFTDQLTFSCWVKADNVSGTNTILDKYYDGVDRSYYLRITSTRIYLSLGDASGAFQATFTSDTTFSNDVWYNIIITFNSTNNEINMYINGTSDSKNPQTKNDTISTNTQPLRIGGGYNLLNYFDGMISNVAVWDRAITEDDILRVYNGGSPGDLTNLNPTSWWSLGADSYFASNWICPDIGANTNNGTSINMAEVNLVGIGPDSLANGTSTNLDLATDLIGEAPGSTGNAISINMNSLARTGSTP